MKAIVISQIEEFLKDIGLDRKDAEGILAAIRTAENDAFELAAVRVAEFLSNSPISKPICEVIRYLKHSD